MRPPARNSSWPPFGAWPYQVTRLRRQRLQDVHLQHFVRTEFGP